MESFIYKGTGTDGFTDRKKWNYLGSCSLIDNPEYLDVVLDSSNKVIEGIQMNGMKYLGAGMNIGGNEYYVMESPEWIRVVVDGEGKVLCGIKQNGKFYADIDGIDEQVHKLIQPLMDEVEELVDRFDEIFKLVENPEYMSVELDNEEKVLGGRKTDGTKFENVGLDLGGGLIKGMDDLEGRMEIKTDSDEKIISYRKEDGTLVENVGIETNHLELTEQGMSDFQKALRDSGFQPGGAGDWSDRDSIELPEPKHYALLNLIVDRLPLNDGEVSEGHAAYYDGLGNYFKLECSLEAQGQTSRIFARTGGKGNYTIDLPKDIKFGSWVPQDSFHLKGCAKDVVRGILPTSYKWAYLMQEYLGSIPNRVLVDESGITETAATGKRINDWPSDARCLPDGFPCEVYVNGEYWGLYSWQLKKHRKNYSMDKKDYTSFFLDADAMMTDDYQHGIWNDGPDDNTYRTGGWWTGFDIKGPKDLICMDGSEFDGDHPKELIDETSEFYNPSNKAHKGSRTTKNLIRSMSTRYNEVKTLINNSDITTAKEKFNEYFDYDACMLVYIFNCLMNNADSVKKNTLWGMYGGGKIFPALWDLDGMYGTAWVGDTAGNPSTSRWTGDYATSEWPLKLLWTLYETEIKETYSSLRNAKIISVDTWHNIVFNQWVNRIGEEAYNRDIKKWPETPSYRENYTDTEHWRQLGWTSAPGSTPIWTEGTTYNEGTTVVIRSHPTATGYVLWMRYRALVTTNTCPVTEFYTEFPIIGGFYDSPKRWQKWISKQIELCDNFIGYVE